MNCTKKLTNTLKKKLTVAAALLAMSAGTASAAPMQWTSASGGNDNWYELIIVPGGMAWTAAFVAATSSTFMGSSGYLATITSQGEQDFLNSLNPGNVNAWLGGTDLNTEGTWEWATGEAFSYTNWAPGEPNDFGGNEDYVFGWWVGDQWNDVGNGYQASYVVEYDAAVSAVPLPAGLPLVLGGLGILGFAARRRKKA